jgi:CRISPR-associated protein Cas5d
VERVSYAVITPSAARGLLEAVLWKPAIQWRIRRIRVLNEIAFTSFRRNEVQSRAKTPSVSTIEQGGVMEHFFADEDRAQRNTVALRDVDYVVTADFRLTPKAGPLDSMLKFVEIFQRRVEKGQHFHQPYFGCREFTADIRPATGEEITIDDSRDLGLMLWDIAFAPGNNRPVFFRARLDHGVLEVPEAPEQEGAA